MCDGDGTAMCEDGGRVHMYGARIRPVLPPHRAAGRNVNDERDHGDGSSTRSRGQRTSGSLTETRVCDWQYLPERFDGWVANYYSARNPLRLSSLVILGVVARMFRCATRSSCWCT